MIYSGILFYPEWNKDRSSVQVIIQQDGLHIKDNHKEMTWHFKDLSIIAGGSNKKLLFFHHQESDEHSLYIEITTELLDYLLKFSPSFWENDLQKIRKTFKRTKNTFWAIIASLILFLFIVYSQRQIVIDQVAEMIPFRAEEYVGEKLFALNFPNHKLIGDSEVQNALEDLLVPLRKSIPHPYNQFKAHISKDETINAFAMPGGHMIFNLGLLKNAKTAEELLGVAAHEMAHIHKRHVIKGMLQGIGLLVVVQSLLGDFSGVIAFLIDQGSFLMNQSFSRDMEIEADQEGFQYLVDANINPMGMISFFKLLQKENETMDKVHEYIDIYTTHPPTSKRIEKLEELYDTLDNSTEVAMINLDSQFKKLKQALH